VPIVHHQHVLVLPRPRLRSCRRPLHTSPASGRYSLPRPVLDRLQAALQPARNREAALVLAVFLARYWSAPGRLELPFPADRRALCGHRDLPLTETRMVHGHRVRVLPGAGLLAFCAGLRMPAVYVSEGTLLTTGEAELRAILAHEEHHRARRDPLRLLLARVVADALRPLPPFAALAEREAALADLAAGAATVDALGDRGPLAAAFLRFATVAPERVDRLTRTGPSQTVPLGLLGAACAALAGIAACIGPMHGTLPQSFEAVVFVLLLGPACLAARRAGACLRPLP